MKRYDVSNYPDWYDKVAAGDEIELSGTVYTARDAAHKRIFRLLDEDKPLPFDLKGAFIYYAGPTPAAPEQPIGSAGPTTSARMDIFTPRLFSLGLSGCIGKGERSPAVRDAIVKYGSVYLCAIGGAGALAAAHITSCEEIAFGDLGCESVKRLQFDRFPLYVAYDSSGGDIFKRKYKLKAREHSFGN